MAADHDGTDGGEGVTFSTDEETPNEGNSQSNKMRDEVQMEWISLRRELMDLLDRKAGVKVRSNGGRIRSHKKKGEERKPDQK